MKAAPEDHTRCRTEMDRRRRWHTTCLGCGWRVEVEDIPQGMNASLDHHAHPERCREYLRRTKPGAMRRPPPASLAELLARRKERRM